MALQSANRWALKEWAIVCRALDAGEQSILLRKGGIDEGPDGFRLRHPEFWLLPTRFHERSESLAPGQEPRMLQARLDQPAPGTFRLAQYGVVEEFRELRDTVQIDRLAPLQILSADTLHTRFQYRQPGLSLMVVRVYRATEPQVGMETPQLATCKSWAELPNELRTAGLLPVLSEEQFATIRQQIAQALAD